MSDCLVIGGNGFIGSHLVDQMVARGHEVTACDRFGSHRSQFTASGVQVLEADFLNVDDMRRAVAGRDVVVHMVSTTDPATSENDPTLDIRTNMLASVQLFQLCAEAGVGKVVFASTGGAIYGDQDKGVFSEDDPALPVSPYAIGKLTIENYLRYFARRHGLKSTAVRISNPYGPRQNPRKRQGVIPIFLRQIAAGETVTIYGDGSSVRDYIYVADAAAMVADVALGDAQHHVYNIGSGTGTSLNEILTTVAQVTGQEITRQNAPVPPTYVDQVTLNTSRFDTEFGRRPLTSLAEGIAVTWEEISNGS